MNARNPNIAFCCMTPKSWTAKIFQIMNILSSHLLRLVLLLLVCQWLLLPLMLLRFAGLAGVTTDTQTHRLCRSRIKIVHSVEGLLYCIYVSKRIYYKCIHTRLSTMLYFNIEHTVLEPKRTYSMYLWVTHIKISE